MRCFIIHMHGDEKRAPNVQKLLAALPDSETVDAVIGRDVVTQGGIVLHNGDLFAPRYPFPLGPGEVGCFLSHRNCWQRILDEDLDYALIIEDDLALESKTWAAVQALIESHANADSFFRLPAKHREFPQDIIAEKDGAQLFLPKVIGLQTVAQVVGRNAARSLLQASQSLDRPVDTFLQMHWVHGQPIHTILPNGVSEITQEVGGSTIQKRPQGSKLLREVKRAIYRSRIKMRPQRPT